MRACWTKFIIINRLGPMTTIEDKNTDKKKLYELKNKLQLTKILSVEINCN